MVAQLRTTAQVNRSGRGPITCFAKFGAGTGFGPGRITTMNNFVDKMKKKQGRRKKTTMR